MRKRRKKRKKRKRKEEVYSNAVNSERMRHTQWTDGHCTSAVAVVVAEVDEAH